MERKEREEHRTELTHLWADAVTLAVDEESDYKKVYAMALRWFDFAFDNCVLACRKNQDYSGRMSPIKSTGMVGIATRIVDKAARLFNLVTRKSDGTMKGESVRDTLKDLSNYGIIGEMEFLGVFDAWQDR